MALFRVPRTATAVLSHVFRAEEDPTDAGEVTVTLKRLDGTVVDSATAQTQQAGTYTYPLPAQPLLDALTLDWAGTVAGAAVVERDVVEICGGFLFGLAEARKQPPPLDRSRYPSPLLAERRIAVEEECERITRTTWVPRFMRVTLPGSGRPGLATPHTDLRSLRAVRVDGTALSPDEVAAIGVSASGVLVRPGGTPWPHAGGIDRSIAPNIVIEYEHGLDAPPEDLREAAMLRLRSRLGWTESAIPQRAISFSAADGGTYRLSTPSRQRTGIPDVDAVYERYGQDLGGFA